MFKLIHGGAKNPAGAAHGDSRESASRIEYELKCEFIDHLFRRYSDSLNNYLNKLTGSPEEAEEVIQETYLRLIQTDRLDRLEARARSYLFAIATNLVRDRRRYDHARSRDRHVSIDDAELACDLPMLEQVADWDKALNILRRCLLELQPRCQRVFLLHCLEGLTYAEIAVVLKVSRKTVERDFGVALELCQLRLRGISES